MSWAGLRYVSARLRQLHMLRSLEKTGFVRHKPDIAPSRSVLIIGSGPSASAERVRELVGDFDLVIALNSAKRLTDRADIHSYEFAYRHPHMRQQQFAEMDKIDFDRTVLKPFSLVNLSAEDRSIVLGKWSEHSERPPRFLEHCNMPATLVVREPHRLLHRDRIAVQWRGSLTLWLDLCWLAGARRIGLVGTDLGSVDRGDKFTDHLTNQTFHGEPGLLGVLAKVREVGYLDGIRFQHFHMNETLRELLGT